MRYVLAILFWLLFSISTFACEFLIYARDYEKSYKKGDIVVVFPDGHKWGKEEGPPKFVIVKVPGMSVKEGRKYMATYRINKEIIKRRRFCISKDFFDMILKQGETVSVDKTNFFKKIEDKAQK